MLQALALPAAALALAVPYQSSVQPLPDPVKQRL